MHVRCEVGEKAEIASKSYLSLYALSLYLQAIMSYVWYECPKMGKEATIREMMDLLTKAKVAEKAGDLSELDKMMEVLPDDHPAKIAYLKVRSGAKDTIRSIIISAHARLAYLQNPKVLKILDHDDMNIRALGEGIYENPDRKTALFCIIPDNDKSYNFLIGMLYTQIFQELYYVADFKYGGSLPVPVAFWLDEFANVALPDGFTEIISTMRSRNISANIILQNKAQLQALFKDTYQAIIGNCDTLIYLGGNEPETHKYITEMLGKYTLGKRSSSESLGSKGSASSNFDVVGRELMTPDEVRRMDNKKELVFIRGCNPIMDDKYHTLESPEFAVSRNLRNSLYPRRSGHIRAHGKDWVMRRRMRSTFTSMRKVRMRTASPTDIRSNGMAGSSGNRRSCRNWITWIIATCSAQRHWARIYTVTLTGSLSHFRYSPWRTRRESVPEARPWSATRFADSWKTERFVRIRMLI